ncbi:CheF family chemotaxis protein [Halostagnicola sp. A-GB9-2]|uniref:CheF family chemotaxis protein n=1 Tax=Halostagnicola sp. A-GB9-2 TaxID=3048066 RepID=UPI0024BF1921|nr:CheF family chemotaxis protein [Halostagnicola sp. A-GB9-2]MDJ1432148.1 CheF family chemotaxis protein [Halostagnicola sp. A-GB9-2]
MSKSETKLADVTGQFTQVVKEGRKLSDTDWSNGRIVLSNKRLVIASNSGKQTIPLGKIQSIRGRYDVNQTIAKVSDYISINAGQNVFLVSMGEVEAFELQIQKAILDGEIVLVKHPAVKGGVVQDSSWKKARVKINEGVANFAVENGNFVQIEVDDVGTVENDERGVRGQQRPVIEAEHTEEGTSVQTYLSGGGQNCAILKSVLDRGAEKNASQIDLSSQEQEVLMAIYSGVSPFEVPEFLDIDTDDVEEMYERMIELDVLEEVRVRREVALKPRGRNIASESMNSK